MMKKKPVFIFVLLIMGILLNGCSFFQTGSNLRGGACYWINQERYDLPTATDKTKSSPILSRGVKLETLDSFNGDIYVTSKNDGPNAFYWKNGEEIYLSGDFTEANDIFVSGTDVYVAGVYRVSGVNPEIHACYWKNEQVVDLGPGFANSIFVKDSVVYIAGVYCEERLNGDTFQACYWVDGQRTLLDGAGATGIFVEDTDIYISGNFRIEKTVGVMFDFQGCYWKNGVRFDLDNAFATAIYAKNGVAYISGWGNDYTNETAKSIFVSGNDIYVAGSFSRQITPHESYESACYWRNGEIFPFISFEYLGSTINVDFGEINDIYVSGADVFLAGHCSSWSDQYGLTFYGTGLWFNGKYTSIGSKITSVFVVPQL